MIDTTARVNPFRGPRSFQTGDTLYGRDHEARALLATLIAERIVLLHSPSGAGKTSLVQAALVPMLEDREFAVLPVVRVGTAPEAGFAGNRYLRSTLLSLEEGLPREIHLPAAELDGLSLASYLAARVRDDADPVLIFDQFEEVLTRDPTDIAAKHAFFEQLGAALRERRYRALFSMREDYVAALEPYLRHLPTRLSVHFRLDLLGVEGARQALAEPPRAAGVIFPDALVSRLIDDLRVVNVQQADGAIVQQLGPSVEPVQLQVLGLRLWQRLGPDADTIGADDLAAVGDVNSALGDYYAEQVAAVAAAGGNERAVRAWFDRELITPQGVRGQVLQGAKESAGLDNRAIRALIDAYLVRAEPRRGATWFELAHDRLIAPIRASNIAWEAANLSPLQRQAELWERQNRPADLLPRDNALREAEAWAAANAAALTETERAFLRLAQEARATREREQRQARRLRALGVGAGLLLLAVLAAGGIAYWNQQRAEREARVARARALAAAAVDSLRADPARSLLLARAAADATRRAGDPVTAEARSALTQAVQDSRARRVIVANPPEAERRGLPSVAYSPDGAALAATTRRGELRFWDAATGEERPPLQSGAERLVGLAYSPDGTRVAATGASAAGDEDSQVFVWDAATGALQLTLEGHTADVYSVAFSPDGTTVATASADGTARIWDAADGAELHTLEGHEDEIYAVAFSPDGSRAATAGADGTARIWDATSGAEERSLDHAPAQVRFALFTPDGDQLITAADDGAIRIWSLDDGALLNILRGHTGSIEAMALSPDGLTLASAGSDNTARVWNLVGGRPILTLAGHFDILLGVAFSPAGRTLATSSQDGTLRLWSLALAPADGAIHAAYSPDGASIASAGADGVSVWDAATGALRFSVLAVDPPAAAVRFSPDSALLAAADVGPMVRLVDAATGEERAAMEDSPNGVNALRFSPDGSLLATAGYDGTVRVWDLAAEAVRYELPLGEEGAYLYSLAFSPDGAFLAAGNELGTVGIWDVASGQQVRELVATRGQPVFSLDYAPDGGILVAADAEGAIVVWDGSGAEVRRILARAGVNDIAFSPDGRLLAAGGSDQAVTLWDVATWTEQTRLPQLAEVNSVSFRPDGAWLATAGFDGVVRTVPLSLDDLLRLAAERTVRPPTPAECAVYNLGGLAEGCGL